jgi:hypothetical protein
MKARAILFALMLGFAAASPLLPKVKLTGGAGTAIFPGWPANFDGQALTPMPPAAQDVYFTRDFPGKVARFSAEGRQVVLRWVNAPTRRLHPASHCFAGAGYQVQPLPMDVSSDGSLMSCFSARKPREALRVCEQLRHDDGRSWPDISSWYWHALAAPAGSSWWSYVMVEREAQSIGL